MQLSGASTNALITSAAANGYWYYDYGYYDYGYYDYGYYGTTTTVTTTIDRRATTSELLTG